MDIRIEAKAREFAIRYGVIELDELIDWADINIKSMGSPPTELFDLSLAKDMNSAISAINAFGETKDKAALARRIFTFFYNYLNSENPDYERISRGIYDMALSEILPSPELMPEMCHYWDALDLAELGYYGDPAEVKKSMVKLLHENMDEC